jgi:predicted dehydrogenase
MPPIRLALIGCGKFVRFHLHSIAELKRKRFEMVALCDVNADNARARKADYYPDQDIPIYTDHKKMLREVRPDAVIVSTPHTLHYRHCSDAIAAGAHVMVEKPMVTDSGDARKLVAQAEKAGKVLEIAIQGVFTDTFAYARQLIQDGTMGKLQMVTGLLGQDWYDRTKGLWRQNPKLSGGGQLYDSSAHVISAMMFLVDSPVREVYCTADYLDAKVDINAVATVRFENGCMATINSGGNCPVWKSHLMVQGAGAYMEISPHGGDFFVRNRNWDKDITKPPRGWKTRAVKPAENFADAIEGKDEVRCGARLGILLSDLMDGLYASIKAKAPVTLPLKSKTTKRQKAAKKTAKKTTKKTAKKKATKKKVAKKAPKKIAKKTAKKTARKKTAAKKKRS